MIILIFSILISIAYSVEEFTENKIKYSTFNESDYQYVLVGTNNESSTDREDMTPTAVTETTITSVTIPKTAFGYPVLEIGCKAFASCLSLSTVTIQARIRQINMYAFHRCKSLTSINIPPTCEFIGYAAISCVINDGENGVAATGVLTIKFEPNATIKYIGQYGIEQKQVIIIFFCGDNPPTVPNNALFNGATFKVIYAPKAISWGGVTATVDENACNVISEPIQVKYRTCKRQKIYNIRFSFQQSILI